MPRLQQRKRQCEDCLQLDARTLLYAGGRRREPIFNGVLTWSGYRLYRESQVFFHAQLTGETPHCNLHYRINNDTGWPEYRSDLASQYELQQSIDLAVTSQRIGKRLWFACECGRRALVLYLPIGAPHFLCRHCHDLVYRSSQTSSRRKYRRRRALYGY